MKLKLQKPPKITMFFAWDLCRLGYFSKNVVNKDSIRSSFAFQSKGMIDFKQKNFLLININIGQSATFCITELAFDGAYIMAGLNTIQISKSANTLETLASRLSLRCLIQVVHVLIESKKRRKPNLKHLETLISEKKDCRRNSSLRF